MSRLPPASVGPYRVVRELGRGGMGVVYEVRDPAIAERRLALKLILGGIDAESLVRLEREAQLLARVKHPSVVAIHAFAYAPEGPYLVTDFVEGQPLSGCADWTPAAAAALVRALCDAVAAVHAVGIVHRDLKPHNVIVRPDGSPVLLDFGVARSATGASLTRTGEVVGSPRYMAPEQAEGKGAAPVDERTDVYGLGAILFELLAGAPPFAEVESTPFNMLFAVLEREPTFPAGRRVPPALQAICRRAMAKDPAARFQSAPDLRAALAQALSHPERWSRLRGSLTVSALAVIAIVAVGAAALRGDRSPIHAAADVAPTASTGATSSVDVTAPPPSVPAPRELARRWTLPHAPGDVRGVWLGPTRVVTVGGEELRLWDLAGASPVCSKTTPTGYIVGRAVVAGDRLIVSSAGLQAFTLDGLAPIPGQHDVHFDGARRIGGLAVSPDGRSVAYGYEEVSNRLHVVSAERLGELRATPVCFARVEAVAYSRDGTRLFCASRSRSPRYLSSWELGPDGVPTSTRRDQPLMNGGRALAVSLDGADLVVGTSGGTILRLAPDGSASPRVLSEVDLGGIRLSTPAAGPIEARDVAFSADGALLFTLIGDEDGSTLEVWAREGWRRLITGRAVPRAGQLAPSPDGRWLLVGMRGRVEVWDVPELRAGDR